jgi:indolepyruvate ferredoxin oxidoreductase
VRLSSHPIDGGVSLSSGSSDVLLGFDVIGAATAQNLSAADPARTVAVVSTSVVPTVEMVIDVDAPEVDVAAALAAINDATRAHDNVFFDAHSLAMAVFGDAMPANVIVLGAAWQCGTIPMSLNAIRQAFTLNGVAVERNLAAFEWGRAAVASPATVAAALEPPAPERELTDRERSLLESVVRTEGELRRLLEIRVPDLLGWGGRKSAEGYLQRLRTVRELEAQRLPGSTVVTEAFAVGLHKLIAYKDEYEVARLHLEAVAALPWGSKATILLHPPFLRALGVRRKLAFGSWFTPVLRVLKHARRVRGTPLDLFGYSAVRRVERALPGDYSALVVRGLQAVEPASLDALIALAKLPDVVRGYEDLKLRNVERFRSEAAHLVAALESRP